MSRLNELMSRAEDVEEIAPDTHLVQAVKKMAVAEALPTVTSSKAKWGSLLPAILGGVAAPFTAQALPDHILASMGFWQYLVWIIAQAGLFYGATFLNVYLSPPNAPK